MAGARTFQHLARHCWRRRFGDKRDDLGLRIGLQHTNRVKHHQAANLFAQIASTGANQLGNPAAKLVNAYAQLLATGTGGANNSDVAATHRIAKTQRRAVNNGGSAIGTHHQQPFFMRQLLERQFVFKRDVVREQHHVEVILQRLTRFTRGKQTIDRDHRQVAVRNMLLRTGERGIARFMLPPLLFMRKQVFNRHQRLIVRRLAGTFNDNHQVATFRLFKFRREQTEILQYALIHFCRHSHERLFNAIELICACGDRHQ